MPRQRSPWRRRVPGSKVAAQAALRSSAIKRLRTSATSTPSLVSVTAAGASSVASKPSTTCSGADEVVTESESLPQRLLQRLLRDE